MARKQLSWIHLSDWHFGQKSQWLWPNFRAVFLEDLRRLSGEAGPIDLVLVSGDLTQGGEHGQFDTLTQDLDKIWELFDTIHQKPKLFCVPGNHDLVRPPGNDARVKMLAKWDSDPETAEEFWGKTDNQYIKVVHEAFANYVHWQDELTRKGFPVVETKKGILPGDSSSSLIINDVSVGLVGLNSAFLQLTDSNFEGKLALDSRQLNAVTDNDAPSWCSKHDINLLITHHPLSWLNQGAVRDFQSEIYTPGRFTAHLFGHMHEADLTNRSHGGDAGRKSYQSASLFGMEHLADGKTERNHGYAIGQISFECENVTWKLWPRKGSISRTGDRKLIPDHENFNLEPGFEYQSENLIRTTTTSKSFAISSAPAVDLAIAVEKSFPDWNNALLSTSYPLAEQEQHLSIRQLLQMACAESIRQHGICWVCSDWGLGRNGFLWSVMRRLGRSTQPVYRIDLGNYGSREAFLTTFSTMAGCSFPEFCKALAASGPAILMFDEAPVSSGDTVERPIECDAENLARMVKDFCPDIIVFLLARTTPREHKIGAVALEALDEADTKSYLIAHPSASADAKTPRAVTEIYRLTDGLPGKIDTTLRSLRVASLSDLGLAASIGNTHTNLSLESIPSALVHAVNELAESKDSSAKRSYLLLKALAILPHGESLQRLKRIDPTQPIFPKHGEELLDLDLIQVRSSTTLMGIGSSEEERLKILVAPRPVRDYVLSRMTSREIDGFVRKAIALYFGENWRNGVASLNKIRGELASDDGSLVENPHALVLRLLEQIENWDESASISPILNLCHIYCGALLSGKYYRSCAIVCRDILTTIPASGYEKNRGNLEIMLAKALRMSGEHEEARALFEKLLQDKWPKENKVDILSGYALCLQSLEDEKAISVANELINISPKSAYALQAQSIILEMQDDVRKKSGLLLLEDEARKRGFNTVANNLVLGRISEKDEDPNATALLRQVYQTAVKDGDSYNAARAAVKIGSIRLRENGSLSKGDLTNLITAYQYFYGERFNSLFIKTHRALWDYFESQIDVRNLVSLFRHSSFIWRLHGNDSIEQTYVQRLTNNAREILSVDAVTADKNTAYFLLRARDCQTTIKIS
ncbi:MAG: putative phosphohydrolase [Proteobacteria bacterium]|nr:putative phosphohydrolase [Pseudomonadota bacterium]